MEHPKDESDSNDEVILESEVFLTEHKVEIPPKTSLWLKKKHA